MSYFVSVNLFKRELFSERFKLWLSCCNVLLFYVNDSLYVGCGLIEQKQQKYKGDIFLQLKEILNKRLAEN